MNNQHSTIIELREPVKKRLLLVLGILVCSATDLYMFKDISRAKEAGWITIALGSMLSVFLLLSLLVNLFIAPQKMIVEGDTISIDMLFRKRRNIRITDIVKIDHTAFLSFFVADNSGWLICSNGNEQYLIAKPFYANFDNLILAIREHNPTCPIDDQVLNWKGPRYLI